MVKLSRRYCIFILLSLPMLLAACSSSVTPVVWQAPGADWIYPKPPEKPRIKYLRSIAGLSDLKTAESSSPGLFSWFGAEEPEQYPLTSPYAVTADGNGRIWLTDPGVGLVYLVDLGQREIDFFSVLGGKQLATPTGIVFDVQLQRLFVSDSGLGEVLVFDSNYNYLLSLNPPKSFARPGGMALDMAGNLYVADVLKGTIEKFSSAGRHIASIGSQLNSEQRFNHPSNISVDSAGRLYVVDSFNFRVEVVGLEGEGPVTIGELGDSAGSFARPRGIAVDSGGHVYVSDAAFDNIQVFNRQGELLLVFGRPGYGQDAFCLPAGLSFDQHDRLYVADSCGHQVKIFQFLQD